jgi:ABC-2 type transport system permease protein
MGIAGVAFNVHGLVITPLLSVILIVAMGAVFFFLCVNRFGAADFSKIKIFRHSHR